ncbi:aldose 1-epimerase [Deinobacterium chartae]|uniref:Aldose 1-epimerase n=1 Tax=Deinobacterium chartae TaxID=521158 RepID=A0A841I015_9DEIO|nr:aldose 1-epimerase [Deinobacterium chartae]MBB6097598.1 aldose 1-epimerase [Deinobacterium chartae]
MTRLIRLENDTWQLDIAPEVGGSVAALRLREAERWTPVMRETPASALEERNPSQFASFTLMPYSNRIRDAAFEFTGQSYTLRPNTSAGTAQHGDVRARPWQVEREQRTELALTLDSRDFADFNYPFPIRARVEYLLEGDAFDTVLHLENAGERPMPAGFGIHPYFRRDLGGHENAWLQFRASGVYHTGPDLMPTEGMQPLPAELDFTAPRAIGDQNLDHVFGNWNGRAELSWPDAGLRLEFDCEPVFSHFVAFTAPDGTLALEPVSHATDAFNLEARGVHGTGMRVLEPGESMQGRIRLAVRRG